MTNHTITLTEPIAELLDRQMTRKGFGSVSEYIADLVARDASVEAASSELRSLLQRAKDSGVSAISFDDIIREARSGHPA